MIKLGLLSLSLCLSLSIPLHSAYTQYLIYEDKMQLEFYGKQLAAEDQKTLLDIIKEKGADPYKCAAAVRILANRFLTKANPRGKNELEDTLRTVFRKAGSSFVRIEIASALCRSNRDLYFTDMVPFLIRRLENENQIIAQLAFSRVEEILQEKSPTEKEARLVLNAAKRLIGTKAVESPNDLTDANKKELDLIRWSIQTLGKSGYRELPYNITNLLEKGG